MTKKDVKLINEIYYGADNKMYTVVTGGVDNTSEEGFDIFEPIHVQAAFVNDAFKTALKKLANQNPLGGFENGVSCEDIFPEIFTGNKWTLRTNDNSEFICAIEGQLDREQCYNFIEGIWNTL